MKYEFQDESGNCVEIDLPMASAPSIGDKIMHEGRSLVRVASIPQVDPGTNRSIYPYVSNALPRRLAGCRTTAMGKPIIESKRHERNVMARHGYEKD